MIRMRKGADESPLARYELYQKAFRISVIGNMVMAGVVVIFQVIAWSAWSDRPEPQYFATYEDGEIIPLVAQSQPFLGHSEVVNFAVKAVTKAFSMNFDNWSTSLDKASGYFQKPEGWTNFLTALHDSGILIDIVNSRLISNVIVNEAYVVDHGIDRRSQYSYYWTVQILIKISFESATETSIEDRIVNVVVSRIPTWESPHAIGVTRISMH